MQLNLQFQSNEQIIIHSDLNSNQEKVRFKSPLNQADLKDIQWYLETYAALYTTEIDDKRAGQIAAQLSQWGIALFNAVFNTAAAQNLFNNFQKANQTGKLLTIVSDHPEILALPWELLHHPKRTYLVHDTPQISVRRTLLKTEGNHIQSKERLRLLYIISRPTDAGFIDPRADAVPTLEAIEQEAAGRVEVEFLRPGTFKELYKRLNRVQEYRNAPPVDIVHFDGHGSFADGVGYLVFETPKNSKTPHLVPAKDLGEMLHQAQVRLVILSACQSAMVGEDAMGSVAAGLTNAGIPGVLAMTHSVLVVTARKLFGEFYRNLVRGQGVGTALDNARSCLRNVPERGERQRGRERITLRLQDWFLPALYQAGKDVPLLTTNPVSIETSTDAQIHLVKLIKDSPVGQELSILNQHPELINESLVDVVKQAIVVLTNRGDHANSDRFLDLYEIRLNT